MHKLTTYLHSEKIQRVIKENRPQLNIIISDMYQVGEGEKKIVNYINKYFKYTNDKIMFYSPDADGIMLSILLPVKCMYILRYNNQETTYDLINIKEFKNNIDYYINNHEMTLEARKKELIMDKFNINNIGYDLVYMFEIFGNDFIPKMVTISAKIGFQLIIDKYLEILIKHNTYLLKQTNGHFKINYNMFRDILKLLLLEENNFIKHNPMYNQYLNFGQISQIFNYQEINQENLVSVVRDFKNKYNSLQNYIKDSRDTIQFSTDEFFVHALKRAIELTIDGKPINPIYLSADELMEMIKKFYKKTKLFP